MGFLRKVGKKIGKGIKKLGRAIKKGFGKITKAFGKLGPIGHLAMGLILPGMGNVLGSWLKTFGSNVLSVLPKGFANILSGVGQAVSNGASMMYNNTVGVIHKTITGGLEWGLNKISSLAGVPEGMGLGDKFSNFMDTLNEKMTGLKPTTEYTVQAGDTLTSIAENTGVSLDTLKELNPKLADPDFITSGETLKIKGYMPKPKTDKGMFSGIKETKVPGTDVTVGEVGSTIKDVNTVVQTIGSLSSEDETSNPFFNRNIGVAEDLLYDPQADTIGAQNYSFVNLRPVNDYNTLVHQYITGSGMSVPESQRFDVFNSMSTIGYDPFTYAIGGYDQ